MAKKRKKTKPIGKVVEDAAKLLQRLRRLESSDDSGICVCVSCGVHGHYSEMQGGHYIPRGKAATKLREENIWPQCPGCNMYGMRHGSAAQEYTLHMIDFYGRDFVDELIAESKKPKKWYRPELEDLIKEFKARIKQEEERLGVH